MIKYKYRVTIHRHNGGSIAVNDPSVLEQVIAHKDVETFSVADDVMTHYFFPYGNIDSVVIEKSSTTASVPDDAFCAEE